MKIFKKSKVTKMTLPEAIFDYIAQGLVIGIAVANFLIRIFMCMQLYYLDTIKTNIDSTVILYKYPSNWIEFANILNTAQLKNQLFIIGLYTLFLIISSISWIEKFKSSKYKVHIRENICVIVVGLFGYEIYNLVCKIIAKIVININQSDYHINIIPVMLIILCAIIGTFTISHHVIKDRK